ncbi:MAG: ACT domain-containing protein, partial [Wolbachia endosymbiont of Andrena agilissima]|nr:ACT domain-containing protein [Wolbachia endosymbiont of Andrena agilissima]
MKHNIKVQVLSTFKEVEGTTVLHKRDVLERYLITGITYSTNEALVTFTNLANNLRTLRDIAGANVKIDMIHGSSFVISKFDIDLMEKLLNKNENYAINDNVAKISIIGIGVMSNTEVMHRTLKVLSEKKIEILAITTSEIKISIIVQKECAVALVKDLHTEYELDMQH